MRKIFFVIIAIITCIIAGIFYVNRGPDMNRQFRVGVILDGKRGDRSWSQSHYEGIRAAAQGLPVELEIEEQVLENESCLPVFKRMIDNGCRLIVANSYSYGPYLRKVAAAHPHVQFLQAGGDIVTSNVSVYFGRIYQMRYLAGMVAGLQTKTNKIGYIAAYPIPEVNRGINAFTLGVRKVNPEAQVYVNWASTWESGKQISYATEQLLQKVDVDVLTIHVDSDIPLRMAAAKGIWTIGYHYDNAELFPKTYLTAAVWDWQHLYRPIFQRAVLGRLTAKHYWEGVENGVVKLAPLTEHVDKSAALVLAKEQERMRTDRFDVFYGPIKDNQGNLRVKEGQNLADKTLLEKFDWYVEGVVNLD